MRPCRASTSTTTTGSCTSTMRSQICSGMAVPRRCWKFGDVPQFYAPGERNRLLLARLFTRSFNFLIMDEPTNDLDIETLELLEALIIEYSGTLLLVSHDREFIDNTVTSTLVFEGPGVVNEYVGGYQDWLRQRSPQEPAIKKSVAKQKPVGSVDNGSTDQKELRALPGKIEKLEAEIEVLHLKASASDYYQQDAEVIRGEQQQLQGLETELQELYRRWEELEAR